MISLILAMDQNRLIGSGNKLPWRLPSDLAYFKKTTMGHAVIMGRKTFESIGRPLPGRKNVVLTRNGGYAADDCTVCHSTEEAMELCLGEEAFAIGGAEVYSSFLPYAGRLYITLIEGTFEGDTYLTQICWSDWVLVSKATGERNRENPYDYFFLIYERNQNRRDK